MDGVRYQIEQLQYVLGQLDTHRMLMQADAAQLQLALANATAIARHVVERQTRRNAKIHSGKNSNARTSDNNRNDCRNSSSSKAKQQQQQQQPEEQNEAAQAVANGGISRSSSNAVDVNKKKDETDKKTIKSKESAGQPSYSETIASVARLHNVSLDEIRNYNPQLSEFDDEEVLPPNTFIKMKLHVNEPSQFAEISDITTPHQRLGEPLLGADDTMTAEVPLPLAPLPYMQDAPRRSTYIEESPINYRQNNDNDCKTLNIQDDSPKKIRLLMLPSPSPNRHGFSVENSMNNSNIKDNLCAADSSVEVSVNVSGHKGPNNKTMAAGNTPVPKSLFSGSHLGKPPTTPQVTIITDSKKNNDNNNNNDNDDDNDAIPSAASPSPIAKVRAGDRDQSLLTESSSFHSTPTPTPHVSPKPKGKSTQNDLVDIRDKGKDGTTTPPPTTKLNVENNTSAVDNSMDGKLCNSNDISPIVPKKSPYPEESDEDFDTLNSIAQQYAVTVKEVLKWNPYLIVYEAEEPLPPNLPIVLPLQQNQLNE